ncbi:MAG: glucose-1-phosphate cytidylyltransferase [Deferribacteres bacterium]|nr:glucose-1-phosphate cytidylyltransferase [Deferribacteres bacterium]
MSDLSNYKAVILCGGQGTRIRGVAEDKPKPLIEIGGKPILWHIMKTYSAYGVKKFVLALGYQGDKIVDYFENYHARNHDFTMKINDHSNKAFNYEDRKIGDSDVDDWEITFAFTGVPTMTGGRVKRIKKYIQEDKFFVTYGDGVSDIDLPELYNYHMSHGKIATLTGVNLPTTFGIVETNGDNLITSFREKPVMDGFINGGYFVFNSEIFDYIDGDDCVLENKPFKRLVREGQLHMFKHPGFWHCMDHYKDYQTLNGLWDNNKAPWNIW